MGELHELLSVDSMVEDAAKKIIAETVNTFNKKPHLFSGSMKVLEMFDNARKDEEDGFSEFKQLNTTVKDKLDYMSDFIVEHFDAIAQKEATNQAAVANLELPNGRVIPSLPATLLLGLENRLANLRSVYNSIPTLDPKVEWVRDDDNMKNSYKSKEPQIRHRTEKTFSYIEMSPATKEHKAQIDKVSKESPVGNYKETFYSGAITPADKSAILGRLDELIKRVKQARQRANKEKVVDVHIGREIIDFIHGV